MTAETEASPWNLCNSDICYLAVSTQINIYCGDIFNIYIFVKITVLEDVMQLFPWNAGKGISLHGVTSQKTVAV